MKRRQALFIFALAVGPLAALACGVCDEDKVAATYDHAVVARAGAQGRVVVFAEPHASIDAQRVSTALVDAAARTPGIDRASVRTSQSPASFSFALDPRAGTPLKTLETLQRGAKIPGLQLSLLRVVGPQREK